MFGGLFWGKIFLLLCIAFNTGLIFLIVKFCLWLFRQLRENPRRLFSPVLRVFRPLQQRLWQKFRKVPTGLAMLYLIAAILYFIAWTHCSGWIWVCNPYSMISEPWERWTNWNANKALEPFWIRIFSLAVIALNTAIIYSVAKSYEWMYQKLRNNPPKLVGTMLTVSYALFSVYTYIDVTFACPGWFCDVPLLLLALPWSSISDVYSIYFFGERIVIILTLAVNALILYVLGTWLTRLAQKIGRMVNR